MLYFHWYETFWDLEQMLLFWSGTFLNAALGKKKNPILFNKDKCKAYYFPKMTEEKTLDEGKHMENTLV